MRCPADLEWELDACDGSGADVLGIEDEELGEVFP
jgi:hypothetical protein